MKNSSKTFFIIFFISLLSIAWKPLHAEKIVLKSGEIIEGTIIKENTDFIVVKIQYGEIKLLKTDIRDNPKKKSSADNLKNINEVKNNVNSDYFGKAKILYIKYKKQICHVLGIFIILAITFYFKMRVSVFLLLLAGYIYFFNDFKEKLSIVDYSHLMHNKTYAMEEIVKKEDANLNLVSLDVMSTLNFKNAIGRLMPKFKELKDKIKNISPPYSFKQFHKDYIDYLNEALINIDALAVNIAKGNAGLEQLKLLHPKLVQIMKKEQALIEEFKELCANKSIKIKSDCDCKFHKM